MPKKVAVAKKKTPKGTKKAVAVKKTPKGKMPPMMPTGKGMPMSMPNDTDMDMM